MERNVEIRSNPALTGFSIKLIAIVAMTFDHVGAVFFPMEDWFRIIGRMTMPIMCYFIAEGYFYTKNKKKYAMRLLGFAILSQIPYQLCFANHGIGGNVFWTLLLGMLSIWSFESICLKIGYNWGIGLGILVTFPILYIAEHFPILIFDQGLKFSLVATDYGMVGVVAIFLAGLVGIAKRYFENNPDKFNGFSIKVNYDVMQKWIIQIPLTFIIWYEYTSYGILNELYYIMLSGFDGLVFLLRRLGPMFGSVVLMFYGGARGNNAWIAKYLFYLYYPLHLGIISLIMYIFI